jgi:hypothetical protein
MQVFRRSIFTTECDECRVKFAVNTGGVCDRCRRILCNKHLHGSAFRRIAIAMGAPYLCLRCRSEQQPTSQ